MKIRELTEATYENIRILKMLADYIVKNMEPIPRGQFRRFDVSVKGFFNYDFEKIEEMLKSEKLNPILKKFKTLKVFVVNNPDFEDKHFGKKLPGGYYNSVENEIFIFMHHHVMRSYDIHIKDSFGGYKTLIHELRHMVQFAMFSEFASKEQIKSTGWSDKKIEWDAVFHDVIDSMGATEDDVFSISDIKHLANEVVGHINTKLLENPPYIKLPKKAEDQYYKQAIKFYLDQRREYLKNIWKKHVDYYDDDSMEYTSLNEFLKNTMNFYGFELIPAEKNYFKQKSIAAYRKFKFNQSK